MTDKEILDAIAEWRSNERKGYSHLIDIICQIEETLTQRELKAVTT